MMMMAYVDPTGQKLQLQLNQHSFDAQSGQFNTRNTEGYLPDGVITNVPVVLAVVDAVAVVVGEAVTETAEFLVHPVQQLNNRTK